MATGAPFEGHHYMNLVTYRLSGHTVATPVWFVLEDDTIYVATSRNAGKVKRIRNTPQVLVEPCDARGTALGPRVSAHARIVDGTEHARINTLFNTKYGLMKRLFDLISLVSGRSKTGHDVFVISLDS